MLEAGCLVTTDCITDPGNFHFPASCYTISLPSKVVCGGGFGFLSWQGKDTLNTCPSHYLADAPVSPMAAFLPLHNGLKKGRKWEAEGGE